MTHKWSDGINSWLTVNWLKIPTNWLRLSGMKVKDFKTELCLFYRKGERLNEITVNNTILKSKPSIGVEFDPKLQWNIQVANAIK
jgi:hypothetical protein